MKQPLPGHTNAALSGWSWSCWAIPDEKSPRAIKAKPRKLLGCAPDTCATLAASGGLAVAEAAVTEPHWETSYFHGSIRNKFALRSRFFFGTLKTRCSKRKS
jgi:hypothetical protein